MRQYKFNRILSFVLVMVMVIIMIPTHFFPQVSAESLNGNAAAQPSGDNKSGNETGDETGDSSGSGSGISDFIFDSVIKPNLNPEVTVTGLPDNADAELEIVGNPFVSDTRRGAKSSSSSDLPKFLDFYDIKAVDKDTGEEIHPVGEVEVTINEARIRSNQSVYIIHVLDDENVIRNSDNYTLIDNAAFVNAFKNAASAAYKATGKSGVVAVEYIYDFDVDGYNITFKTSSFSIFAIAENPILTVNFYNGPKNGENTLITSIRVKKSDADDPDKFEKIIYDPGVNKTLDDNVLFRGWFETNDYTVEDAEYYEGDTLKTNALTIAQVREKIVNKLNNFSNGDEMDFFAMLYVQYTVTYFDQAGNVCLGRDFVLQRYDNASSEVDYQVTLNYVPYGQFENFEGWMIKSDSPESGSTFYNTARANMVGVYNGEPDGTPDITGTAAWNYIYTIPTWTRIKGDIYLYAYSPEGNWLIFDENGKGGTYVAPQFVKTGYTTINPNIATNADLGYPITMQRYGYDFGGWFTTKTAADDNTVKYDEWGTTPPNGAFTFGQQITDKTTIYASWVPHATANYVIIIWTQNINADGYDFYESIPMSGNVGSTVNTVSQQGTGNDAYARITGTGSGTRNIRITGFHLKNFSQNVVIKTENNAVVHIYYDRTEYTLTFRRSSNYTSYTYTETTSDTGTQYGYVNGEYVQLSRSSIPSLDGTTPYTGETYYIITDTTNRITQYGLVNGNLVTLTRQTVNNNYVWLSASNNYSYFSVNDNDNNPAKYGTNDGVTYFRIYRRGNTWRLEDNNSAQQYNGTAVYIRFQGDQYTGTRYINSSAPSANYYRDSSTLYALNDGAMVPLQYYTTWTYNGEPYTGTRYTRESSGSTNVVKTITALYQQDISQYFPIHGDDGLDYTGYVWNPQNSSIYTTGQVPYIEAMREENTVFVAQLYGTGTTIHMYYYTESLPGQTGDVEYNGKQYDEHQHVQISASGSISSTRAEDFSDISGFTQYASDPAYGSDGTVGLNSGNNYTIRFYYSRNSYRIQFMDGTYVDGNGNVQDEVNLGELGLSDLKPYGDDISSYNTYKWDDNNHTGYVFEGWYLDETCTQKCIFPTMPEGGITVYAKWVQVQYRVFLHPNAGSGENKDNSLDWGSNSQAMNFRVSYEGTISVPTGLRTEYTFAGWYTDPGCTKSFIPDTRLNETTVTSAYDKTTDMTDKMDKWGDLTGDDTHDGPWNSDIIGNNGSDRFWINKKLDLYAKWRKKIVGADGMYLKYVTTDNEGRTGSFDDGSTEFSDDFLYTDGAFAYGLAACNAPTNQNPELHFRYWVVQRWDASTNTFFDAKDSSNNLIIVYPGERFETDIEYALKESIPTTDPNYDPNHNAFKYYMVLRAEYTPAVPQETTIVYDANGGSFTSTPTNYTAGTSTDGYATLSMPLIVNTAIDILPGTIVTREGYTFMGWSLERNGEKYLDGGEQNYSADNLTAAPAGNDPSNTLYAIWEINRYSITVTKTVDDNGWAPPPGTVESFVVGYTVSFPEGYTRDADKDVAESGSVTVSAGGSVEIDKIPHGSTITVTENVPDNFVGPPQYAPQSLTVTDDTGVINITNVRKVSKVTITKAVEGTVDDLTDAEKKFEFTITATQNNNAVAISTDVEAVDGKYYLADGDSITVTVPAGAKVAVTETTNAKFYTDVTDLAGTKTYNSNTLTTAALAEGDNGTITFTNTRKVTVKAVKELDANGVIDGVADWTNKSFPITFSYTDVATGSTVTADGHISADGTTATDNSIVVRYGTSVTVTEDTSASVNGRFVSNVFNVTQPEPVTANALETTATIKNTLKVATVTVNKTVIGTNADQAADKKFRFTLTAKLGNMTLYTETFELSHGTSKTIKVPASTLVTVTETEDAAFYTDVIAPETTLNSNTYTTGSLDADAAVTVSFRNTRKIKVYAKKVIENSGSTDTSWDTFEFPITFTAQNTIAGASTKTSKVVQGVTEISSLPYIEVRYGSTVSVAEDTTAKNNDLPVSTVFDTTYSPATVTADESEPVITITNTRKVFTVTVTKVTVGTFADGRTFNFTSSGLPTPSDGVALGENGSFSIGDGVTKTFLNIPYGNKVTITEESIPAEYTTAVVGASNGAEFTVTSNKEVIYTNTQLSYNLIVSKTVSSLDSNDLEKPFEITVKYWLPNEDPETANAHTITFNLIHRQSNNDIDNQISLPYGSHYEVVETDPGDNYLDPVITNGEGDITGTTNVTVANERDTVEIDIVKVITYDGDKITDFTFSVTAPGVSETVIVSAANGYASGSGKVTVPKGSSVTVTETDADTTAFTVTSYADDTAGTTGTTTISFTANDDTRVTFTNKRNPITVTVTKTLQAVTGVTVEGDDTLTFPIKIEWVDDTTGEKSETVSLANTASGEIQHTYTIENVKYGTAVTISEPDLDPDFELVSGAGTFDDVKVSKTYEVVNKRKTVTVTVNKTVEGTDKSFSFTPVATWDGKAVSLSAFDLGNGGSKDIVLPMGAILTVTEATDPDYFTQVALGDGDKAAGNEYAITTAITDSNNVINFTNTEIIDVTVQKSFTGNVAGDDTKKFDVKVKYTDALGEVHTSEQTTLEGASTVGFADNESKTFKVLYGTDFTVYEATEQYFLDPSFAHTASGNTQASGTDANTATYTIKADDTITVTNARAQVTVKVTKSVNGNNADFSFTATAKVGNADVTLAAADASKTMGNNGEWIIHLPAGATLTVTETENTKYYTTVALNGGDAANAYSQSISTAITDSDNVIAFTNTEILTVTVTKSFTGVVDGDSTLKFPVTVTYTDATNTKHNNEAAKKDGATETGLANGDTATFQVLYNTAFTVSETVDSLQFEAPTGVGEQTITADTDITVTNARKTTTVVVTKEIVGADLTKNFSFTASAKVGDANVLFDGNTEKKFTLNGSEGTNSITITLPAGAVFTVTEAKVDGYNTYVNSATAPVAADADATHTTGTLAADTTTKVPFKNVQLVTITFKKVLSNPKGVQDLPVFADFTVNYTQAGLTGTQSIVLTADDETGKSITVEYGTAISDIAEDTTKTNASGIAVGAVYTPSYSATSVSGEQDVTVTVTNTVNEFELKILKITDDNAGGSFAFTLKTTNLTTNLDLNQTVTADATDGYTVMVPYGTTFTVLEKLTAAQQASYDASLITYVPGGSVTKDNNVFTITGDGTVTINNFRNPVKVKVIKTVVSDVTADFTTYNFTYTYVKGDTTDTQGVSVAVAAPTEGNTNSNYVEFTVPAGSAVNVEETGVDTDAFKVEYTYGGSTTAGTQVDLGTLSDLEYEVTFTNTRNTVNVTVKKVVKNFTSSAAKFPFSATWTVGSQTENVAVANDENLLGNDGTWTFTVPYGANVAVTEDGDATVAINGTNYAISTAFDTGYEIHTDAAVAAVNGELTAKQDNVTGMTNFVFTNTRKNVSFKLEKELDNKNVDDGWNTFEFPIRYRITDTTNEPSAWTLARVKAGTGNVLTITKYDVANNEQEFIPFGAKVEIEEINDGANYKPEGITHTIGETFKTTYDPESKTATVADTAVTFKVTNVRNMVDVKINKEVKSDNTADFTDYAFTVTVANAASYNGTKTVAVGSETKKGTVTFKVPYGTDVTVEETGVSAPDFDTFIDGTKVAGIGITTGSYVKSFTDVTTAKSVDYVNRRNLTVTVNKQVVSDLDVDYTTYPFEVKYNDVDANPVTTKTLAADSTKAAVTKTADGSFSFVVPYGTTGLAISELLGDAASSFTTELTTEGATVTHGTNDQSATVATVNVDTALTFKNTRKTQTVTVNKVVDSLKESDFGADADTYVNYSFDYTYKYYTVDGTVTVGGTGDAAQTLLVGVNSTKQGSKDLVIPYNAFDLVITEAADTDANSVVKTTSTGTDGAAGTSSDEGRKWTVSANVTEDGTVTFTNRRVVYVTVRKILDSVHTDTDNDFTFSLSYAEESGTVSAQFTIEDVEPGVTGKAYTPVFEIPYGVTVTVQEIITVENYDTYVLVPGGESTKATSGAATITAGLEATPAEFVFTNHRIVALTINKTVDSEETSPTLAYTFTVDYVYDDKSTAAAESAHQVSGITVNVDATSLNGTKTIYLPYGATGVVITETPVTGYDTVATSETAGTNTGSSEYVKNVYSLTNAITAATAVNYTNTRMVEVKVTKELDSEETGSANRVFNYTYTYTGTSHNTSKPVEFTVQIGVGNTVSMKGSTVLRVPYGVTLKITEVLTQDEIDNEYYIVTADGTPGTVASDVGPIQNNEREVVFSNKRVVKVKIIKVVDDPILDSTNNTYSFTYGYTYGSAVDPVTVQVTVGVDTATGATEYIKIPYNARGFYVTENDVSATDFDTTAATTNNGGIAGTLDGFTYTLNSNLTNLTDVTFTNKRMINVPVTKIVESSVEADYTNKDYAFTYTWSRGQGETAEGETDVALTVTVNDATNKQGTATVRIPYGATITVTETEIKNSDNEPVFQTLVNGTETLVSPAVTATTATVGENGSDLANLTFTNKRLYTVTVTKTLDNLGVDDAWNTTKFPVNVTIANVIGTTYATVDQLKLAGSGAGSSDSFRVPHGATVTVAEVTDENGPTVNDFTAAQIFTTSYTNNGVTVEKDEAIGVSNVRKTRQITITKTVDSKVTTDFRDYSFEKSTANWTTDAAGNGTFTLTPATINVAVSTTVTIPVGVAFTVTEDTSGNGFIGMETWVSVDGATAAEQPSATVPAGIANATVSFLNKRVTAELTIVKNVADDADCTRTFMFKVEASDTASGYEYSQIVMIRGNGSVTLTYLQTGYEYTVTELTDWSWEYDFDSVSTSETLQVADKVVTAGTAFYFVQDGTVTFGNKANDTNWLRGEAYVRNVLFLPVPAVETTK